MSDTTGPAGEDNVVRLAAYRAAHPEISITPPGPGSLLWTARDRRSGKILCSEYWLSALLNTLDWLAGQRCGRCGGGGAVPAASCACRPGGPHTCVPVPCPSCGGSGRAGLG